MELKEQDLFNDAPEEKKEVDASKYRIRKLTPKECFRLQGVKDADADKMLLVNSNSQCYKQAGNSITVSVLEALFRNLNIKGVKNWNEIKENYDPYASESFSKGDLCK